MLHSDSGQGLGEDISRHVLGLQVLHSDQTFSNKQVLNLNVLEFGSDSVVLRNSLRPLVVAEDGHRQLHAGAEGQEDTDDPDKFCAALGEVDDLAFNRAFADGLVDS